ncbi:hypothetical protein [Kocuria turfanensis]|uniref:Uncharacterized protein n=1 Tax=Kocuria turfanensis TaxID=388357 RepID=A0A512IDC3_9MICC|nr:hypothetical protein [Kocuria turfanensis]GEO95704.1 hypothetical protein KTU01_18270 [Kocuria turfanensis]
MDLPGVLAGRHIVRGAAFGAAAGAVLALFTRNGHAIDLGVLVGVALELLRARVRGDLTAPAAENGSMTSTPPSRRLDPLQTGLFCGLAVGVVVAALTRQLFWIAACTGCGAGVGWLLGRTRPRPHEDGSGPRDGRARAGGAQREDETDDQDRVAGLPVPARRRAAVPPPEPGPTSDPEPEVMARARDEDLLNGVFILVLYNHRHARPVRPGREPVDIRAALSDLHDEAAIEDAILRTEELLAHAVDLAYGARDAHDDRVELQLAHPGFSPEHLSRALNWGHRTAR